MTSEANQIEQSKTLKAIKQRHVGTKPGNNKYVALAAKEHLAEEILINKQAV